MRLQAAAKEERTEMNTTLIIMAAGMGSRYGGNKQVDAIGPGGEILMEYSIYDAIRAGFNKVVFIIKREMLDTVREMVGDRIAKKVQVEYAFQDFSSLPAFYQVPAGRTKPFGTVHAILCARDVVHEPFAVLNADDYYGVPAFQSMHDCLQSLAPTGEAAMVGYRLCNTVSENGTVTRGVCSLLDGKLAAVKETYKIRPFPDGTIRDTSQSEEGAALDPQALVSMNFWGFTPWIFEAADAYFTAFLKALAPDSVKGECLLPIMVDDLMRAGGLSVRVLSTDAVWFGITYREDKPYVMGELKALHAAGVYPKTLRD